MSERTYLLVSKSPMHVPSAAARQQALDLLQCMHDPDETQRDWVETSPTYFGEELEYAGSVTCPGCGKPGKFVSFVNFSLECPPDWLDQLGTPMAFRWIGGEQGEVEMTCCGTHAPFASLTFSPPLLMARYAMSAHELFGEDDAYWQEPENEWDSTPRMRPEKLQELETILGCGLVEMVVRD